MASIPDQMTDGDVVIEGGLFINRVVRRVIALIETNTRFGRLYEIDMRLRPSGRSGLMVVGLDAPKNISMSLLGPGSYKRLLERDRWPEIDS